MSVRVSSAPMRVLALVSLLPQGPQIEMSTYLPTSDVEFVVRALDQRGDLVGGAALELCDGTARQVALFMTAPDGSAKLTVAEPGAYVLRWRRDDDVEVLVPFHVASPRTPLSLALWTIPLGLLLGWSALRSRPR